MIPIVSRFHSEERSGRDGGLCGKWWTSVKRWRRFQQVVTGIINWERNNEDVYEINVVDMYRVYGRDEMEEDG